MPTLNLIQRYRWISVLMLLVANGSGVVASTRDAAVHGGEPRGHPALEQARRGADGDAGEVAGDAKWEEVANCRAGWVSTMVGETSLTISRRATVAEGGNEHNVPFPNVPAVSTCGTDAPANRLRLGNTSANMTEAGCGTGDTGEFGPRRVWATRRGTSTPWATMGPWKRLRPHRASDLWELARGTFLATTLPLFAFQAAIAGGVVSLCVYMHAHWVDFDGLAMAICCSVIVLIAAGLHLGWKKAKKGVEARDAAGARTKHPWAKRPPRKPWGSACLMVYALLSGSLLADIEKPYGQVGGGDNVSDLSIGATPRAGKEGDGTVVEGYFLRCRGSFIWNVGGHLGTAAVPLAPKFSATANAFRGNRSLCGTDLVRGGRTIGSVGHKRSAADGRNEQHLSWCTDRPKYWGNGQRLREHTRLGAAGTGSYGEVGNGSGPQPECIRCMGEARNPGPSDGYVHDGPNPRFVLGDSPSSALNGAWTEAVDSITRAEALCSTAASAGRLLLGKGTEARPIGNDSIVWDMHVLDTGKEMRLVSPKVGDKVKAIHCPKWSPTTPVECNLAQGDDGERARPSAELCAWRTTPPVGASDGTGHAGRPTRQRARRQGHRGGKKRHRYDKKFPSVGGTRTGVHNTRLYFANTTAWSEHAKGHVFVAVEADIKLVAETHIDKTGAAGLRKEAMKLGCDCTVSPAAQSANSVRGTHGGLAAMVTRGRRNAPLADSIGHEGAFMDSASLVGREVWINASPVLVLGGYLDSGTGLSGRNLCTILEVERITRTGEKLFVWTADFNATPEEWNQSHGSWLHRNDASIVTPDNTPFTCRTSVAVGGGSLIDYAIISNRLLPLLARCWADFSAPWGPHYGIYLEFKGGIDSVFVNKLARNRLSNGGRARRAGQEREEGVVGDDIRMETNHRMDGTRGGSEDDARAPEGVFSKDGLKVIVDDATWEEEFKAAANETPECTNRDGQVASAINSYADTLGILHYATLLGENLAVWARAAQRCHERGGTNVSESSGVGGRAWSSVPTMERVKLVGNRPRKRLIDGAGGGSARVRTWKSVSRWLRDAAKWTTASRSRCTAAAGTRRCIEVFLSGEDGLAEAATQELEDEHRWQILGELNLALAAMDANRAFDSAKALCWQNGWREWSHVAATRKPTMASATGSKGH